MQKTYNILILISALLLSQLLFSQNNTISPYTQFGVGDLTNKNFGVSNALGGIGYGLRSSQHINFKNPASYTATDSMSFLFSFGFNSKITKYKTINEELTRESTNLNFLAISFPVTKWLKSSIGLLPYSNVGYGFMDTIYDFNALEYNFGNGGINQFYLGNSFEIFDELSVGFNFSYLFGSLKQIRSLIFLDGGYNNTQREDVIRVKDFNLSYGLQYYNELNDKISYTLGINFENSSKINSLYKSITLSTKGRTVENVDPFNIVDTIGLPIERDNENIILPNNIGIGLSFLIDEKYLFGADYNFQTWSNSHIIGKTDSLVNSNSISLGMEYTPDKASVTKYWKRINYRFGAHYSNSYIELFDEQLKDMGLSFGVGIPIQRSKSVINVSFDLGKRGTIENNLILENYGIISLNVSLADIWFIKRKFD